MVYLLMYFLLYGLFYLISLLPFWLIYLISDGFYLIVFYIIGYRKSVVSNNLAIAFPEKSVQERNSIMKQFYHNLIDTFLESIKLLTLSEKSLHKRCSSNFEVIEQLIKEGKNIQLHPGHQFNVEFYNLLYSNVLKELSFVFVYMPFTNKPLDKLIYKLRSRFGSVLVAATDFRNQKIKFEGKQYAITLGSDQNPSYIKGAFWLNFFGKPVPFLPGPARSAVKNDTAIVLVEFIKIKRGYFRFENTILTTSAISALPENLTKAYRNFIEKIIKAQPSNYLWTHKRWKHTFSDEYKLLWIDDPNSIR